MPRPPRIEYADAYYHVMNRGRGRQTIFQTNKGSSGWQSRFKSRLCAACVMLIPLNVLKNKGLSAAARAKQIFILSKHHAPSTTKVRRKWRAPPAATPTLHLHDFMIFKLWIIASLDSGLFKRPGRTFKKSSFNNVAACLEK